MSADITTLIAELGVELTYSAREAAAMLGKSYSWLDQGLRGNKFTLPDGSTVQPARSSGGYRRFTLAMLKDIVLSSYRSGWYSMDELKLVLQQVALAAYRHTGETKIPS